CGAAMEQHRMCDSSLRAEPLIGLLCEIRDAPLFEELGRDALRRRLIGNMLGAVFTKLETRTFAIGLGPRTARTIHAALLVDLQQRAHTTNEPHLRRDSFHRGFYRRDAAGSLRCFYFIRHA